MQETVARESKKLDLSLLKEGIDNVLLLFHIFFTFFQPVALALDIYDGAVAQSLIGASRTETDLYRHIILNKERLFHNRAFLN